MTTLDPSASQRADDAVLDEREVMRAVGLGDIGAFAQVYDATFRSVFAFTLALTQDQQHAEVLLERTYLAAWPRAHVFADYQGSLTEWIIEIAYLQSSNHAQNNDSLGRVLEGAADGDVLRCLSPLERAYVSLAICLGLTQQQIALRTSTPLSTVRERTRRALTHLRNCDQGCNPTPPLALVA
ncbi:sigma factor-like helix-turn-helix DNA-binding protein [Leucobacter musarum]|uniref:sigma factor-like helix-turn-helix DNA-binding protein n=1 Tax=Leucobacter musarum TaxID=1930747 RepID=UPI0006A7C36C|nr:sigma factor-like helix-turn-helix DNA-binding protein [Leucobacter musarum]